MCSVDQSAIDAGVPWPGYPVHSSKPSKGSKSAWNFDYKFRDKTVPIHSKRQFERECESRGLVHVTKDDVLTNGQATRMKPKGLDKKQVEDTVRDLLPKVKAGIKNGQFKP